MSELDLHDNVRDDVRIDLLCEDVIALTEHLRLKELECQQLADDNAKLREALQIVADADSASNEARAIMVHAFIHNAKYILEQTK